MRVLLTGGLGCIGVWIIRNLLERDDEVVVYDRQFDRRRLDLIVDDASPVVFIPGDVCDFPAVTRSIDGHGITHVIHLAGLQVPVCRADPMLGAQVNVVGTLAMFEAMRAAKKRPKSIVYASSAAVFAPGDYYAGLPHPLPDDADLQPGTHYGVFKRCNEGNARVYFQDYGISSIGLRPGSVYGVGRDFGMTSEPTKAIKSIALGRPFSISYGGHHDLQFADDVAKTFILAAESSFQGAKSFNIRGNVCSMQDYHRELCAVAPEAANLIRIGDKQLPISFDLSDSSLQSVVGNPPRTSLSEGIRQTLSRFRMLMANRPLDTSDLDG